MGKQGSDYVRKARYDNLLDEISRLRRALYSVYSDLPAATRQRNSFEAFIELHALQAEGRFSDATDRADA